MRLTVATRDAIKFACLRFHYAHAVPVATIGFNVYNAGGEWCGVILYGLGANDSIGSEYGLKTGEVLELVRVALNGKQEATSQAVAASLKLLREKCPLCRLVVSYSDIDQAHLGTIYQATNWIYTGARLENSRDSSWIIKGKRVHGRVISDWIKQRGGLQGLSRMEFLQKHIDPDAHEYITAGKRKYLYPIDRRIRKRILPLAKPYPKNEDWTPIDYRAQRAAKKAAKQKDTPPQ